MIINKLFDWKRKVVFLNRTKNWCWYTKLSVQKLCWAHNFCKKETSVSVIQERSRFMPQWFAILSLGELRWRSWRLIRATGTKPRTRSGKVWLCNLLGICENSTMPPTETGRAKPLIFARSGAFNSSYPMLTVRSEIERQLHSKTLPFCISLSLCLLFFAANFSPRRDNDRDELSGHLFCASASKWAPHNSPSNKSM